MVTESPARPDWLKVRFREGERYQAMMGLVRGQQLHTVCEEAHCPNIGECFNGGTATFMILGDVCTRSCGFCAVTSGRPNGLDLLEPLRLARAVETLALDYAVITSVNRDDLPDGGACGLRGLPARDPAARASLLGRGADARLRGQLGRPARRSSAPVRPSQPQHGDRASPLSRACGPRPATSARSS